MVLEVAAAAVVVVVVVGWCACGGVSLSFKGELGKPIQIAHRGGFSPFFPARLRQQDFISRSPG